MIKAQSINYRSASGDINSLRPGIALSRLKGKEKNVRIGVSTSDTKKGREKGSNNVQLNLVHTAPPETCYLRERL